MMRLPLAIVVVAVASYLKEKWTHVVLRMAD
jgi:hypothetical protein